MKRLLVGTAAIGLALGLGAVPAGAQGHCTASPVPEDCIPPDVGSETFTPEVLPNVVTRQQAAPQTLPVTGGDVVGLAALGLGAVAGGAGLLAVRRRKTA